MYSTRFFSRHATRQMLARGISNEDVNQVLDDPNRILVESRPYELPLPKETVLGWIGSRPLHVVVCHNHTMQTTTIITAYEPDLIQWQPDYRTKR